jgi:arylsulfatase A-like enzyme
MRALVLVIDGLQPAYLGPYGNEWVATSTFDRWAAEGVVFDQHFADIPEPEAFRRALRTGRHPLTPASPGPDLLTDLRAAGVRTARVGLPLSPDFPYASGWDYDLPAERDPDEPFTLKPTRRAVRRAIELLGDAPNALLLIEIDALLPPWEPSEDAVAELFADAAEDEEAEDEFGERADAILIEAEPLLPWSGPLPGRIAKDDDQLFFRLQRTYAAAVASLDAGLGWLLADCSKRGWGEEVVQVLTSGRGFPLGEHGAVGFAAAEPHEELVHLPFLLRWPNAEYAGVRVGSLSQPADMAPTLREWFGLGTGKAGGPLAGMSLVALARGANQQLREYAVIASHVGGKAIWGIRSAAWYLLIDEQHGDERRRLFVKPDDRWEVNDVRQPNLELADEMEQVLRTMTGPAP